MSGVLNQRVTEESSAPQTCWPDEQKAEFTRKIEEGINGAKDAISEKWEDGRHRAERLLKHGRYAMEDGVGELAYRIKKNPIGFLGIAFAIGAAFGLLLSLSSQRRNAD
jgi:hypothetical protein